MNDLRENSLVKLLATILLLLAIGISAASFIGSVFLDEVYGYDQGYGGSISSYAQSERGQYWQSLIDEGYYYYDNYAFEAAAFVLLNPLRNALPFIGGIAALLAIGLIIFLGSAVGHRKGEQGITLTAYDRIPLDVLAAVQITLIVIIVAVALDVFGYGYGFGFGWRTRAFLIVLSSLAVMLLAFSLLFSFIVRIKAGGWWRNTLIYICCRFLWRLVRGILRGVGHGLGAVLFNLPLLWKGIVGFCLFMLTNVLMLFAIFNYEEWMLLLWLPFNALALAGICYFFLQLDKMKKGAVAIAGGNLNHRISTAHMTPELRRHAENMNNIGNAISVVVEEKMKSERLKTELITNVSHDIKTPLTSIINYVDLMKKEEIPGETARDYLEVLDRQSHRLKKLTEDLLEASKASTGNISVELVRTNVGEMLDQVVAEYGDRLREASLTPIIDLPEREVVIMADGRLLWRVFDNLLNNICKYSQPETRVYFSVRRRGQRVDITMKNISREVLNVSPGELVERFVRGDSARSSEGSGLGLSIARSLTELQQGEFILAVDGDLFKAILSFTAVGPAEVKQS